jgi:hypothetical protein
LLKTTFIYDSDNSEVRDMYVIYRIKTPFLFTFSLAKDFFNEENIINGGFLFTINNFIFNMTIEKYNNFDILDISITMGL